MKKVLSVIMLFACITATAQDFTYTHEGQTLNYTVLDSEAKTCEVIRNNDVSGDVVIPSTVSYGEDTYKVTSIGNGAFEDCISLTSVDIPNSVTSIGGNAFYCCSGLTSVDIPNSVTSIGEYAFSGCSSLTKVNIHSIEAWCNIDWGRFPFSGHSLYLNGTEIKDLKIPNSITSINDYTFSNCSGLTSVDIPNSVTIIGRNAFSGCSGLTSVDIPNSVTIIGRNAFYCCSSLTSVDIPNSVTSIGEDAFCGCDGLTSVSIPNSVTTIESRAFYACFNLTKVNIHDIDAWYNIQFGIFPFSTGYSLYLNGTEIKDLKIPTSITSIGDWAFYACSGLTSIDIPNSVTSIGNSAFFDCDNLTKVNIHDLDAWCNIQFLDAPFSTGYSLYLNETEIKDLKIPTSITSINDNTFCSCSGLISIDIPNSVTSIGFGAFQKCVNLTSVSIPNSVTNIEVAAFGSCSGLTSVVIPNSVKSIGMWAFDRCENLRNIYSFNTTPPSAYDSFNDIHYENATLFVPQEALETYRTKIPWRNFLNIQYATSTGIESIKADGNSQEDLIYDISGRKLDKTRKGLNIINGKKVIIK